MDKETRKKILEGVAALRAAIENATVKELGNYSRAMTALACDLAEVNETLAALDAPAKKTAKSKKKA